MTESFGTRLREERQRRGWNHDQLASSAGVDVATVRRAEGETSEPRLETVRKLAGALEIRVEWLLTGDGDMYEPWRREADAGEAEWNKEIERRR